MSFVIRQLWLWITLWLWYAVTKQIKTKPIGWFMMFFLHVLFTNVFLRHCLMKELWIMNILQVVRSKSDNFVGRYSTFPGRVWWCVVVRLLVWPPTYPAWGPENGVNLPVCRQAVSFQLGDIRDNYAVTIVYCIL